VLECGCKGNGPAGDVHGHTGGEGHTPLRAVDNRAPELSRTSVSLFIYVFVTRFFPR